LANACDTYGFDGYVLEFLIHPQIANTINRKSVMLLPILHHFVTKSCSAPCTVIGTKLKALLKEKGRDITLVGVAHANRVRHAHICGSALPSLPLPVRGFS